MTKALLEAAFDGEDAQLLRLLDKGVTLGKDMVRGGRQKGKCQGKVAVAV